VKHADGTTGGDTAPFAQILQIVAGQADSDLVIHVDRGLFVSGRVLAPAGAQLGEGFVVLDDHARALAVFEPWNADGTFVIGPLLSGTVTLTANSHSGHAQSEGVVAEAGQKNVVLQLRSGGSISGRVLDEEGRPVESSIVLSGHGAGADGMQTSVVESNKEFEFAGLDPGLFGLVAWTVDGRAAVLDDIDVAAGSAVKGVELHVVPAGHVRIRYVGPDRNGFVEVTRGSIQVASGGFARDVPTVLVAPPGMVRIRLLTSETHHILERTVEVKVGETSEVTIDEGAH
jgi:hypothetical protein